MSGFSARNSKPSSCEWYIGEGTIPTYIRYVPTFTNSQVLPVLNSRFNHEIIFTTADAAAFVVLSNRQLYQSSLLQNASCLWVRSCFIFIYKSHDFTTLLLACIDITSATIYSLIELVPVNAILRWWLSDDCICARWRRKQQSRNWFAWKQVG